MIVYSSDDWGWSKIKSDKLFYKHVKKSSGSISVYRLGMRMIISDNEFMEQLCLKYKNQIMSKNMQNDINEKLSQLRTTHLQTNDDMMNYKYTYPHLAKAYEKVMGETIWRGVKRNESRKKQKNEHTNKNLNRNDDENDDDEVTSSKLS